MLPFKLNQEVHNVVHLKVKDDLDCGVLSMYHLMREFSCCRNGKEVDIKRGQVTEKMLSPCFPYPWP